MIVEGINGQLARVGVSQKKVAVCYSEAMRGCRVIIPSSNTLVFQRGSDHRIEY